MEHFQYAVGGDRPPYRRREHVLTIGLFLLLFENFYRILPEGHAPIGVFRFQRCLHDLTVDPGDLSPDVDDITFGEAYQVPEHGQRKVYYAGREELENAIIQRFWTETEPELEQAEKDRPPQRGRPGQRNRGHSRQNEPADQPIVTSSNLPKKQEAPPPASERG